MGALLGVFGFVVVAALASITLAFPHFIEGVIHLYVAPSVGALAFVPFGKRDLPAEVHATQAVADGYRGTKNVAAPGFEEGRWLFSLDDETRRLRVTVTDATTAFVTVIAKPHRPLGHIERALATVRIRLVDVGEGRRLEARILPANVSLPLALPGYAALVSLVNGGEGMDNMVLPTLLPALVVGVVWQAIWWGLHHAQINASVDRAMNMLQRQLTD